MTTDTNGAGTGVRLDVTSPAPSAAWLALLADDPLALPSQTPRWMRVMEAWGFVDASRLYVGAEGQRAVVPLVRRGRAPDPLSRLASMPAGWGFGGAVTDSPDDSAFLGAIVDDLARQPGVQIHLRPNPLRSEAWEAAVGRSAIRIPARAHVLDLQGGFDRWWTSTVSKNLRKKVRRAERDGVQVRCGTGGALLDEFRDLYDLSIRRFAQRLQEPVSLARLRARARDPAAKYRALATHLGDAFRVYIGYHRGHPVVGDVVLLDGNAHNTRGAMDKERADAVRGAGLLVQTHAIRDACAAGAIAYNMGETGTSSSHAAFKEHLGAVAHDYYQYRFERLPLTRTDRMLRDVVRGVLGVREAR